MHDKSISKGYNEAVNVHSATKTAAINNLKNVKIEAEVHKNSFGFWHFYTGIQKVYKCCRDGTASGVGSMALSAHCRQKAVQRAFETQKVRLSKFSEPLEIPAGVP